MSEDGEFDLDTTVQAAGGSADGNELTAIMRSLEALTMAVNNLNKTSVANQREIANLKASAAIRPNENARQSYSAALDIGQDRGLAFSSATQAEQPHTEEGISLLAMRNDTPQTTNTIIGRPAEVKLYDLPKFTGIPEEWPLFIASYLDSTAEFHYSNRQNLMRLHKSLSGQAKDTVAAMLIYPDDVPKVIEELEFRFGRSELLVRSQLAKVKQMPIISEAKIDQVIGFSTKVRSIVAFLSSAKCEQHLSNPILMDQLVGKLPVSSQLDWIKYAANIKPYPTITAFSSWLSELARSVSCMPSTSSRQYVQPPTRNMFIKDNSNSKCLYCEGEHTIINCKRFESLGVEAKWEVVKEKRLCFACLNKGHSSRFCKNKKKCCINGCHFQYNRLLHDPSEAPNDPKKTATVLSCHMEHEQSSEIFKVVPVELFGPKGKVCVYAMIDEGCAITLLEEEVATRLGLEGRNLPLTLQWYGDKMSSEPSQVISLEIAKIGGRTQYHIKNARTVRNLQLPTQSFNKEKFSHLKHLALLNYTNEKPVILIGLDNLHLGMPQKVVSASNSQPVAVLTKLGWIAYGPTVNPTLQNSVVLHIAPCQSQNLNDMAEEYFVNENFGLNNLPPLESEENKRAKEIMQRTTKRIGNRFETGLLWKDNVNLPNSYQLAEKRLLGIEKRIKGDQQFAEKYREGMARNLEKGYARPQQKKSTTQI